MHQGTDAPLAGDVYKALFEFDPRPTLVLKPDFTIVVVNGAYLQAIDRKKEDLVDRNIFEVSFGNFEVLNHEGSQILRVSLERVKRERVSTTVNLRSWKAVNSPVLDEKGEVILILHRIEPAQTRQPLSGAALEDLIEHAIIETDLEGRIVGWNKGAEEIFGHSKMEALGRPVSIIFTHEDRAEGVHLAELKRARETGRSEDKRWQIRKSGEKFFASGVVHPKRDLRGDIIGYVKILGDATNEKLQRDALAESELRYKLATRAARNIIWDWDLISGKIAWTESLVAELGYEESDRDSTATWWMDHVHPDDRDRLTAGLRDFFGSHDQWVWSDEYRFLTADGHYRIFRDRGSVLREPGGKARRMIGAMEDVTQERNAEALLKQSEARFRRLLDTIPHIVWFINGDIEVAALSRQFAEYTGVNYEKVGSGPRIFSVIHPDDLEPSMRVAREAKARRGPISVSQRIRRSDGQYRWNIVKGNPVFDENGKFQGWIGTTTDIHEQKIAEEALKRAEEEAQTERLKAEHAREELHHFFMQAPVAMCIMSGPEHVYSLVNDAFVQILGRNPLGEKIREAFTEEEGGRFFTILDEVYRTGQPHVGREIPFPRKDLHGQVTQNFLDIGYHATRGPAGDITGILVVVEDVTDQVVARQKIEESEARARLIANNLPLIVWTATPDGYLDWYNDWWYEYLECSRETRWDDHKAAPMHPDDLAKTKILWPQAVAAGKSFQMEQRFRRGLDRQYRWHLVRAVPVRDSSGRVVKFVGANTDIHDQKLLSEELKKARLVAESANQAKSSFLANMSHEIRTPMTAILGFTEVLRDSDLTEEERRDAIARIDNSGRALLRLIDDILDISKIEAGRLSVHRVPFSPVEVATEVVSLLKLSAESKNIQLKFKVDPSTPSAACSDPARIRQILMNLVGNAIKFTQAGQVVLRLRSEESTFLEFEVCDTGIGISQKDQEKLFQPFAQADGSITRTFGGTGLGLLLSRRLTEQLGGTLTLSESAPGKGSRFTARIKAGPFRFNMPYYARTPLEEDETQPRSRESGGQELKGIRVLLAEDVADNQILMRRYLESAGARVRFASNGREAVGRALEGDFDLVLMDIQMPVLDGIEATKVLRAKGFRRPVLALTAHAMAEEVARSLEAGCDAHLTKPISKRALVDSVRKFARARDVELREP